MHNLLVRDQVSLHAKCEKHVNVKKSAIHTAVHLPQCVLDAKKIARSVHGKFNTVNVDGHLSYENCADEAIVIGGGTKKHTNQHFGTQMKNGQLEVQD